MTSKFARILAITAISSAVIACSSPQPSLMNISQVMLEPDGRDVVISAAVVQRLSDERFLVADPTGQINVEIDRDLLGEIDLSAGTHLRVFGEIDRDSAGTVLEAERVQVLP